jgi:hypothetical protein
MEDVRGKREDGRSRVSRAGVRKQRCYGVKERETPLVVIRLVARSAKRDAAISTGQGNAPRNF